MDKDDNMDQLTGERARLPGDLGQSMACLGCALAGTVPPSHFPLPSGLWDQPCPRCGAEMVWVTEVYDPTVGPA